MQPAGTGPLPPLPVSHPFPPLPTPSCSPFSLTPVCLSFPLYFFFSCCSDFPIPSVEHNCRATQYCPARKQPALRPPPPLTSPPPSLTAPPRFLLCLLLWRLSRGTIHSLRNKRTKRQCKTRSERPRRLRQGLPEQAVAGMAQRGQANLCDLFILRARGSFHAK